MKWIYILIFYVISQKRDGEFENQRDKPQHNKIC
jgi:hypothetical protein